MRHAGLSLAAAVALGALAEAQAPAPGMRLYGRLDETSTFLVDVNGNHVHAWTSAHPPGVANYLQDDGVLVRAIVDNSTGLSNGGGGGIERRAFDNTLLWEWRYNGPGVLAHHDIAVLPNGNVLLIAWEDIDLATMTAAGRDPALMPANGILRPDHVVEVRQTGPTTGAIVWEWHVMDHLIQDFDPTKANYGVVADHPGRIDVNYPRLVPRNGDWNHANSIDYDPVHDWIILSPRAQNEIWIIDHGTTTAEARGSTGGRWGKGGDLLYRWGNPAAHGRGTALDQKLFGQHSPRIVPQGYPGAGNIVVFNNNLHPAGSAVWELVLPLDAAGNFVLGPTGVYGPSAPVWSYEAPGFHSSFVSSCERLPNGNTLICSGAQSWIFEVSPAGQIAWQFVASGNAIFHANYVERSLWIDETELSIANGGTAHFDFVGGTQRAGRSYILLGSVSGTSPGLQIGQAPVPLNFDPWMLHTVAFPNVLPLLDTAGVGLDFRGRARSSFLVPPKAFPPVLSGVAFDHAIVTIDPTGTVDFASNPERFVLVP